MLIRILYHAVFSTSEKCVCGSAAVFPRPGPLHLLAVAVGFGFIRYSCRACRRNFWLRRRADRHGSKHERYAAATPAVEPRLEAVTPPLDSILRPLDPPASVPVAIPPDWNEVRVGKPTNRAADPPSLAALDSQLESLRPKQPAGGASSGKAQGADREPTEHHHRHRSRKHHRWF